MDVSMDRRCMLVEKSVSGETELRAYKAGAKPDDEDSDGEEVDEDAIDTEELPELEMEWVSQEPLVEPEARSESPGFWQGRREVVEVPLNVYTLRRMALEFTWANPLEVVGVSPWEPAVPCNIENAYKRRQSEFAAERFEEDPDALEAAATCRRLVQAAYELLADESSRRRWDVDRQG